MCALTAGSTEGAAILVLHSALCPLFKQQPGWWVGVQAASACCDAQLRVCGRTAGEACARAEGGRVRGRPAAPRAGVHAQEAQAQGGARSRAAGPLFILSDTLSSWQALGICSLQT